MLVVSEQIFIVNIWTDAVVGGASCVEYSWWVNISTVAVVGWASWYACVTEYSSYAKISDVAVVGRTSWYPYGEYSACVTSWTVAVVGGASCVQYSACVTSWTVAVVGGASCVQYSACVTCWTVAIVGEAYWYAGIEYSSYRQRCSPLWPNLSVLYSDESRETTQRYVHVCISAIIFFSIGYKLFISYLLRDC